MYLCLICGAIIGALLVISILSIFGIIKNNFYNIYPKSEGIFNAFKTNYNPYPYPPFQYEHEVVENKWDQRWD